MRRIIFAAAVATPIAAHAEVRDIPWYMAHPTVLYRTIEVCHEFRRLRRHGGLPQCRGGGGRPVGEARGPACRAAGHTERPGLLGQQPDIAERRDDRVRSAVARR